MRWLLMGLMALMLAMAVQTPAWAHKGHAHPDHEEAETVAEEAVPAAETRAAVPDDVAPVVAETEHSAGLGVLLSNLHPVTTHFPIGLLVVAAIVQGIASMRRSDRLADAAAVMAIAGGIGAVLAAAFGWIHTGLWFGGDATMQWHRWMGTGLAVIGAMIAVAALRRERHQALYKTMLYGCALAVLAQGYLGAEISRGEGHLWAASH